MNHLLRISKLVSFIHSQKSSEESLARFLVLDTFSEFSSCGIYLGLPRLDGKPVVTESFGIDAETHSLALRVGHSLGGVYFAPEEVSGIRRFTNEEVAATNLIGTGHREFIPFGFSFTIELPFLYSEAGMIFLEKEPPELSEIDEFIGLVGLLIASHHAELLSTRSEENFLNRSGTLGSPGAPGAPGAPGSPGAPGAPGVQGVAGPKGEDGVDGGKGEPGRIGVKGEKGSAGETGSSGSVGDLTSRQLVVLAEMRRGKSNAAIADDLDYSESLIRQETIEIYRKMGITGRSALSNEDPGPTE